MVQTALHMFYNTLSQLGEIGARLGILLLIVLAVIFVLGLLDRDRFRASLNWLSQHAKIVGIWTAAGLAIALALVILNVSQRAVDTRLSTQQSARFANAADPDGGQTVQSAPRVTLLKEVQYTRSMNIPPEVYARIKVTNGWESLLPYFDRNNNTTVKDLQEGFVKKGKSLVYTRNVVIQTEEFVSLESSKINTNLGFVDPAGGRGTYYNAEFNADYTFVNPNAAPAIMRFVFPLPEGSGTLRNFKLTVNGKTFSTADLANGSFWEGIVPAKVPVKVNVTYQNQGARSWNYQLNQRREAIKFFNLSINADRPAKFQRYSMFPTKQTRNPISGQETLQWQLEDVITAQDVAVVFTQSNIRETLGKVGYSKFFIAFIAAALFSVWAWSRRLKLTPLVLGASVIAISLGFTLGDVLNAYIPVILAQIIGSVVAFVLGDYILGSNHRLPLALICIVPLVFLTGGNAGLIITLLAIASLILLLRPFLDKHLSKSALKPNLEN